MPAPKLVRRYHALLRSRRILSLLRLHHQAGKKRVRSCAGGDKFLDVSIFCIIQVPPGGARVEDLSRRGKGLCLQPATRNSHNCHQAGAK
jgi:hypothetical protein